MVVKQRQKVKKADVNLIFFTFTVQKLQNKNGHVNNIFMKPTRQDSEREASLSAFEVQ